MAFCIIYITHSSKESARDLAGKLVAEKLAACANVFPIESMYWWEGIVEQDQEWVSIVKTIPELWVSLKKRAEILHPYDVPCIMKIEVEANEAYEKWIRENVREQ
jgi:periplasmic divalent cation tolerance protein